MRSDDIIFMICTENMVPNRYIIMHGSDVAVMWQ